MTHGDVLNVEYYDLLTPAERAAYRAEGTWADHADDAEAVAAEFDRIDSGLKARCLS